MLISPRTVPALTPLENLLFAPKCNYLDSLLEGFVIADNKSMITSTISITDSSGKGHIAGILKTPFASLQ